MCAGEDSEPPRHPALRSVSRFMSHSVSRSMSRLMSTCPLLPAHPPDDSASGWAEGSVRRLLTTAATAANTAATYSDARVP